MHKNVLILSASPRQGGNSDALAERFACGARDAGHPVETVRLRDKAIGFCTGCLACQATEKCVLRDGMDEILPKLRHADVVVFATPVYFYEMSGQMKTLLDRTNPLFPSDYAFRDIYLLASAAEPEDSAVDGAEQGLNGWLACFDKARLAGVIRGVGATAPGDMQKQPAVLDAAYRMGKSV